MWSLRRAGSPSASLAGPVPWLGSQYPFPSPRRLTSFLAKGEPLRGSMSYGFAAADPGVRAGVSDSASCLGGNGGPSRPAPFGPLPPGHPRLQTSRRGERVLAADGAGWYWESRSTSRWFAFVPCRPGRWVPAFAGTTVGGDAAIPSRRAHVGAASAAMGARGKLARCRRIAGIAGSHREQRAPTQHARDSQPPSCLRRQAPSDLSADGRHRPNKRRRATHYTTHHRTVRCRQPSPSPRCLESRACGWKRPVRGRAWTARRFRRGRKPSRKPPPGRPGPPRRSHKTLAAQRLSCRKERRKSSRRGRRLPASRPRNGRQQRGRRRASPTKRPRTTTAAEKPLKA
ncbi:hypothetical protein FHS47_000202 [Lutibacter sp. SG786]|nr:hypothetical protein [Luteibacter sp. SG786]